MYNYLKQQTKSIMKGPPQAALTEVVNLANKVFAGIENPFKEKWLLWFYFKKLASIF